MKFIRHISSIFFLSFIAINAVSQSSVFQTDSLNSINLKGERKIQVYLPSGYKQGVIYPVVLATDGQLIAEGRYDLLLDSLIEEGAIPPIILIAPCSNEELVPGTDFTYRQIEYIQTFVRENNANRDIYTAHKEFFMKEALEFVVQKYGMNSSGKKLFYGTSNGGAFGIDLATGSETGISHYICLSPLGSDIKHIQKKTSPPCIYIAYGDEEEKFYRQIGNKELSELGHKLQKSNYPVTINVYNGGHDRNLWKNEFVKFMTRIFRHDNN